MNDLVEKYIKIHEDVPGDMRDLLLLLANFTAEVSLVDLDSKLYVHYDDGLTDPTTSAKLIIKASLLTTSSTPALAVKQAIEIWGRDVKIDIDSHVYKITYRDVPSLVIGSPVGATICGQFGLTAEEFFEQTRLKMPKQIVDFIFFGKNPYTE